MNPAPEFEALDYKGSGKLDGRVALITGGDSGIGRAVAVLYARSGLESSPRSQRGTCVIAGARGVRAIGDRERSPT